MLGRLTRKTDVYAFGIVLFQVLSRELPWHLMEDESYSEQDLRIWAQENVDSQIRGETSEKSLTLFIDIIWRSLQNNPGERPSMNDVVLNIQKAVEWQEYENLEKQVEKVCRQFVVALQEYEELVGILDLWYESS